MSEIAQLLGVGLAYLFTVGASGMLFIPVSGSVPILC